VWPNFRHQENYAISAPMGKDAHGLTKIYSFVHTTPYQRGTSAALLNTRREVLIKGIKKQLWLSSFVFQT